MGCIMTLALAKAGGGDAALRDGGNELFSVVLCFKMVVPGTLFVFFAAFKTGAIETSIIFKVVK